MVCMKIVAFEDQPDLIFCPYLKGLIRKGAPMCVGCRFNFNKREVKRLLQIYLEGRKERV